MRVRTRVLAWQDRRLAAPPGSVADRG
jgi:hypothetical protein